MMLFAFVYTHGVSAEGVAGHLDASAIVPAVAAIDGQAVEDVPLDHHGGGHGPSHPDQECVPGQPQQTPALDAPSACALVEEGTSPSGPPAAVAFGDVASAKQLLSTSIRATVLQV
ncbi:hypothetical protein [Streptomyces sp. V1I1]|uniref:hypothetical protein n=1 Tax=Streptomyces sp. V1I1 TaxID=3042272 RepID=UPI0027D91E62|nr:hypothetical protein [Streptomyces sp. V1I1]